MLTKVAWLFAVMLAIVGPPFVALSVRPYEPPLRVGMTAQEVFASLPAPRNLAATESETLIDGGDGEFVWEIEYYQVGPDWVGNNCKIAVRYEADGHQSISSGNTGRVVGWKTEPLPRTRPPWLDRALKAVGW